MLRLLYTCDGLYHFCTGTAYFNVRCLLESHDVRGGTYPFGKFLNEIRRYEPDVFDPSSEDQEHATSDDCDSWYHVVDVTIQVASDHEGTPILGMELVKQRRQRYAARYVDGIGG